MERVPRFSGALTIASQVPSYVSLAALISRPTAAAEDLDHGGVNDTAGNARVHPDSLERRSRCSALAVTGPDFEASKTGACFSQRTASKMARAVAAIQAAVSTGIGVSLVVGLVSAMVMPGLCPTLKEKDEFEVNRFMGTWFEIFRTPFIVEYMVKCVRFHYLDKGEEQSVAVRLLGERTT
ncbi:hypothetical protein IscW_ISCW008304 [Ixodes scapularis]|uniref:Uncharacterized protein n=1 Tax=Ixodes scapularis TaxID=6945 RepID=B7PST5_IXOSC|nr:hypothetical protein IscW_ISCW008304 [Ixodes scapularis]|eukprot:XP_002402979.1 hypothetical protein IscW_ISCW008304 [Ixodes scapularis]